MSVQLPRINDYLKDKNVFITGVTGFLGKVLLEKLIRSTPNVNRVYVLLRSKKGKSLQERLADLKKFEVFSIVNKRHPNWLDKVVAVEGDCSEIKLGLSQDNWKLLKENVHVIFHVAASVRFDDPLHKAILLNVRGTREVCQLALEAKKLDVFVHVSTTYCNNHYKVVDEKLYPPLGDWRQDIKLATEMDEQSFNIVTKHFTHFQANTYTYTKGVTEHLVNDMCNGKVPTVIIRPSIVTVSLKDPFPGWVDNFNGPGGIALATAKGINRVQLADEDLLPDYVPVDIVIKMLILGACWKATIKTNTVDVLNANAKELSTTAKHIKDISLDLAKYEAINNQLWFPTLILTRSKFAFTILFYLMQLLPSIIIDGILKLVLNKTFLVRIQRKIYNAGISLNYFLLNQWTFNQDKMLEIASSIHPDDKEYFYVDREIDHVSFVRNGMLGGKQYLLKESVNKQENYFNKMYYIHKATLYALYAYLSYFIYKHFVLPWILNVLYN